VKDPFLTSLVILNFLIALGVVLLLDMCDDDQLAMKMKKPAK
jgi:hypothetical protein